MASEADIVGVRPSKRVREMDDKELLSPSKTVRTLVPSLGQVYNSVLCSLLKSHIDEDMDFGKAFDTFKEKYPSGPGQRAISDFETAVRNGHIIRLRLQPLVVYTGEEATNVVQSLAISADIDNDPTPLEELVPCTDCRYDMMHFEESSDSDTDSSSEDEDEEETLAPSDAVNIRHDRIKTAIESSPLARCEYNAGFLKLFLAFASNVGKDCQAFCTATDIKHAMKCAVKDASPEGCSMAMKHLVYAGIMFSNWFVSERLARIPHKEFYDRCFRYIVENLEDGYFYVHGKFSAPSKSWMNRMNELLMDASNDCYIDIGKSDAAAAIRFGEQVCIRFVRINDAGGQWILCA